MHDAELMQNSDSAHFLLCRLMVFDMRRPQLYAQKAALLIMSQETRTSNLLLEKILVSASFATRLKEVDLLTAENLSARDRKGNVLNSPDRAFHTATF